MTDAVNPVSQLTAEELKFVELVRANPGSKLNDGAAIHFTDEDTRVALWKRPEELGIIRCVGSFKWEIVETTSVRESAPWPMLSEIHLQALMFAYNEGYSKAYDRRVFPNPFAVSGSQAAAWALGTAEGAANRTRDDAATERRNKSFKENVAAATTLKPRK